jgi:two-component system capsular synthesis response regulator RcsB
MGIEVLKASDCMSKRIIIADDHPIIRAGLRMLLENMEDVVVAAEADSADTLLAVLRETPADLLIADFSMPLSHEADGLLMLQRIRRLYPGLPILVLTMVNNVGVISAIAHAGVRGLIDKSAGMTEITQAIQMVRQGREYVSATFKPHLVNSGSSATARLSPREMEVLRLFASGMTVSAIAERLSRSVKTVSRQKTDAMTKLGLKNDIEIYMFARENDLV